MVWFKILFLRSQGQGRSRIGETLISGGLGQLSLAVLDFRVNQAAYDPDEGYVYLEFEFDKALVVGRMAGGTGLRLTARRQLRRSSGRICPK